MLLWSRSRTTPISPKEEITRSSYHYTMNIILYLSLAKYHTCLLILPQQKCNLFIYILPSPFRMHICMWMCVSACACACKPVWMCVCVWFISLLLNPYVLFSRQTSSIWNRIIEECTLMDSSFLIVWIQNTGWDSIYIMFFIVFCSWTIF